MKSRYILPGCSRSTRPRLCEVRIRYQYDGVELANESLFLDVLCCDAKLLRAEVREHIRVARRESPVPRAHTATGHYKQPIRRDAIGVHDPANERHPIEQLEPDFFRPGPDDNGPVVAQEFTDTPVEAVIIGPLLVEQPRSFERLCERRT